MRKKKSFLSLYKKTKQKQKRQREHTLTPNRLVKRACLIKTPNRFTFVTKRPITFSPTRSFKRKRNFGTPLSFRYTFGANLVLSSEKRKITNFDRNNILQKLQTVHLPLKHKSYNENTTGRETKRKLNFEKPNSLNIDTEGELNDDVTHIYDKLKQDNACADSSEKLYTATVINDLQTPCYEEPLVENTTDDNHMADVHETIRLLTRLVKDGKYSTSSISFKLFKDTLRWYSSNNTSLMRYSPETKEFFWTGKRLLGGQFIRFMRGFAHQGLVKEGKASIGNYDPSLSGINLPVPSNRTLNDFKPTGVELNDQLDPGILQQNIDMYANAMPEVSYVVMFDGKKITPQSTDIYLLDKEDEPKISDMKQAHAENIVTIEQFMKEIETHVENGIIYVSSLYMQDKSKWITSSKEVISLLGTVTKSLRKTYSKRAVYLKNTEKKLEETNDGKYKFVCNKIRTLMYQINICIKDLLSVIDIIMQFCAEVNGTKSQFKNEFCDMTVHDSYRELREPDDLRRQGFDECIPTRYLKQRTTEWFDLRKGSKVTGSVAHKALGLDTLVSQKQFFDSVFSDCEIEYNDIQKQALQHGKNNEINALATLVGKIIPVFYPNHIFHEEGAYVIPKENGEQLIVVSPDGTLRENDSNAIISVEIKCPFTSYVGATPVYYEMKPRHVLQNCLEASVLSATEHLYISWSKESTTAFVMKPNDELTNSVIAEVQSVYYGDYPARPTKVTERVKEMKTAIKQETEKAVYLGEFSSLIANSSPRRNDTNTHVYYNQQEEQIQSIQQIAHITDLIQCLHKAIKQVKEAFNYQKPMASEVLVYLLSDMDRTWHREVGHGLPISYLFKGYSLTMGTAARILDEVLKSCFESNVHVPCVTFDGQFARLKDFDRNDQPLTLFALQRKFWSETQKISKRQLVNLICELFSLLECFKINDMEVSENGELTSAKSYFIVQNTNKKCSPIVTSITALELSSSDKPSDNNDDTDTVVELTDSAGLEDEVLDILRSVTHENDSEGNSSEVQPSTQNDIELPDIHVGDDILPSINDNNEPATEDDPINSISTLYQEGHIKLERNDYETMSSILKGTKRQKWKTITVETIEITFHSAEKMNKEFTGQELNELGKFLNLKLRKHEVKIQQNLRKSEKINAICSYIGHSTSMAVPKKQRRNKNVKSLKSLCIGELQKKNYPKEAVAESYARSMWPCYCDKWFETATVEKNIIVENTVGTETFELVPIYSPEFIPERNQLEVRVMDGTHIRTNIKSKIIRHGLQNVRLHAWKRVASYGETNLAPAMLEVQQDGKIMHQQSDPYVRTMFSTEVESSMRHNGDVNEAEFCKLFREWHEAEDQPGLTSFQRCVRSNRLKNWLLDKYDFCRFPTPSQYVKGIPRVTFEGLVCSIDAHILLYAIVKTGSYNWRAVSTLVAENFMGELAERSQNNHGVPSGDTLPSDMTKISELHAMRLKPDRSFQMKTSMSRAYEVPQDIISRDTDFKRNDARETRRISRVPVRNHEFDERKVTKAKHGTVRRLHEKPRGVQPVRSHYKIDESMILPSLRLGIDESALDNV